MDWKKGEVGTRGFFSFQIRNNGHPLRYSFLENPLDRGAWWTVHRVTKSQTGLSDLARRHRGVTPRGHRVAPTGTYGDRFLFSHGDADLYTHISGHREGEERRGQMASHQDLSHVL